MKKFVATLAAGILLAGVSVTTASAQDHEVQTGESLWKIANEYNTTTDELVKINKLKTTVIHPKQIIQVDDVETTEKSHKVQLGDTLEGISEQYGVTITELKAWNNLLSDTIYVGEVLLLDGEEVKVVEANEEAPVKEVSTETASADEQQVKKEEAPVEEPKEQKAEGKTLTVTATAYTADCAGCSGITATGINLKNDRSAKVIAVDPNVIPLGSKVYVEGYGHAIAGDTGGAIKGSKIDLHMATTQEALNWGRRTVNVTIVE